jgi:hypothetical protein
VPYQVRLLRLRLEINREAALNPDARIERAERPAAVSLCRPMDDLTRVLATPNNDAGEPAGLAPARFAN